MVQNYKTTATPTKTTLTVVVATGEDFAHHSHIMHIMPLKENNIDSVGLLSSLPGITHSVWYRINE